jgi:hypothetical protein
MLCLLVLSLLSLPADSGYVLTARFADKLCRAGTSNPLAFFMQTHL